MLILILEQMPGGWRVKNCQTNHYYSKKPLTHKKAEAQKYAIQQEHLKQLKIKWRNR